MQMIQNRHGKLTHFSRVCSADMFVNTHSRWKTGLMEKVAKERRVQRRRTLGRSKMKEILALMMFAHPAVLNSYLKSLWRSKRCLFSLAVIGYDCKLSQSYVGKKMVVVHFTPVPSESKTAHQAQRRPYFGSINPCTNNNVYARFEDFRTFLYVSISAVEVFVH